MKTILAPVDFSPATDRVLAEASTWGRALGARVVLLNVTEPATGVVDYAIVVMSVAQVNEATVKHAVERLAELERQMRDAGVEVETVHVLGSPVPEIVAEAKKRSADYIVIGSHGHTAFYDLLVGSTANGVLKRSPCPVLIVPPVT
jgi:nucleotide-binding universal stress UspA family protein